jgi:acyl-coenzyme A thioesterase PaaI-like protein
MTTHTIAEHAADRLARLGREYDGIEFLRAIASGELPPPPIAELIGFDIRGIEPGRVTFAMEPRLEHLGRRTATAEAQFVQEETGQLFATATSSLLVLP